jgi:uncharacterized protein YjbI with pentapeptide repeats
LFLVVACGAGIGAEMTARQMTEALVKADPARPLDLMAKDLRLLDLSGLDFKRARLQRSDLFGVDLTGANLSGVDLSGARLDRAVVIHADFSGAKLQNTTILRPTVYTDMRFDRSEAPRFVRADLSGSRVFARFDGADFSGANLRYADFSPQEARGDITIQPHNSLRSCDLSGADLEGADLSYVSLTFSKLIGASLRNANLKGADLAGVDFSNADLSGADLTSADLDGANLTGVKGMETARGLASAHNLERAVR